MRSSPFKRTWNNLYCFAALACQSVKPALLAQDQVLKNGHKLTEKSISKPLSSEELRNLRLQRFS